VIERKLLRGNEKEANRIVARVMLVTFIIFTFIYLLNVVGIFIIEPWVMNTAYVLSAIVLLTPTVLVNLLKWESGAVKYICVVGAALFITVISITLTYHVVVLYVYPIAIAGIYFSKKLNIIATALTAVGVSAAQVIAFYVDTQQDDNFTEFYDMIVFGVIPRALVLIAMAVIFTMLCTRTVSLLSRLIGTTEKLSAYHKEMIMGFATLVENKDGSTGGHIRRTSMYVRLLAIELRKRGFYKDILTDEYVENLCNAAPMHDIGKIAVPDVILQKPGKLTEEEFEAIKKHAPRGSEIIMETFGHLEDKEYTKMAYEVARYHHEKWNGRGYPEGLSRKEIPLCARIMAIADVFDAISMKRCYRDAMPLDKCFDIIREGSGQDFDPIMVEVFLDIRDKVEEIHKEIYADE